MNVLFVASEAYPLIKTGGLGDVVYSLPHALHNRGLDIRLLLPGYRALLQQLDQVRILGWLEVRGAEGIHSVRTARESCRIRFSAVGGGLPFLV